MLLSTQTMMWPHKPLALPFRTFLGLCVRLLLWQSNAVLIDFCIRLGLAAGVVSAEQCDQLPLLEYVCCPAGGAIACGNTSIDFCPNGLDDPNAIVNPEEPEEEQIPCAFVMYVKD